MFHQGGKSETRHNLPPLVENISWPDPTLSQRKDVQMVSQTWLEVASYPNPADAQAAVKELLSNGFDEQSISVVYTDTGHVVKAGAINGAIWGAVLGALFGFLFPPAGLLIAAGPIVGILASGATLAAAGALTVGSLGALVSALVQLGMPEEIATSLGEHVHKGDALVIVHATSEEAAARALSILAAHNPRPAVGQEAGGVVSVAPRA
jgi:uncharacterized membrane protein